MTRVVILGAGPAGVGAALSLARRGFEPIVAERRDTVGGNAGSFEIQGQRVDFGSHRLHPAADPHVLATIRGLLGSDLLERPRHGRIRLLERWLHFPLQASDLLRRAPRSFAFGVAGDGLRKLLPRPAARPETFASVLERGLGRTICRDFYFPYARKIWGLAPEEISPVQAHKRVSAGSITRILRRLLPGGAPASASSKGTFFYPRDGFGQISERLAGAAVEAGAELWLDTLVKSVRIQAGGGLQVEVARSGQSQRVDADHVWSTIPVGVLTRILEPAAPDAVLHAAKSLELRAMLLVYLVLEQDRFSEYDAHYFPELEIPMTRVSEPKNYSGRSDPAGRTVLCAEIPCSPEDPVWVLDESALADLVREGLARAGLHVRSRVIGTVVRRLPAAYPIYRTGYEEHFDRIDGWLETLPGLLTFGRQGLYVHDNTHHALAMAQAAGECLGDDGVFDHDRWGDHREAFESHVVED